MPDDDPWLLSLDAEKALNRDDPRGAIERIEKMPACPGVPPDWAEGVSRLVDCFKETEALVTQAQSFEESREYDRADANWDAAKTAAKQTDCSLPLPIERFGGATRATQTLDPWHRLSHLHHGSVQKRQIAAHDAREPQ